MRHKPWIILALAAVVLVVFGRLCINDFSGFDDALTLYANPRLNPPTFSSVAWYWTHWEVSIYIPLTETIWGLLASIAHIQPDALNISLNPWVFHSASVLAHVLTVIGVFALLRRLIQSEAAAFAGAVLFAVHPVQVETIAWASGLKDALCGLFAILSLLLYVDCTRKSHPWRWYVAATICFLCAFLSKPTGIVVPLLAIVIDWMILQRPLRRVMRTLWPWLVLAAAGALLTRYVQRGDRVPWVPLWARPLVAGDALAFYGYKLLLPLNLVPDYGRRPQDILAGKWIYFSWLIPLLIAAILWGVRKTRPILASAGLLFLIPLLPVLGFSPFLFQGFSTTADHYLYLPMLGPALALGWLLATHGRRWPWTISAVYLTALSAISFVQGGYWSTDRRLWEHTLAVNPRSFVAMTSLAVDSMNSGHFTGVEEQLQRAQELAPYYVPLPQVQMQYYMAVRDKDRAIDAWRRLEDLKELYTKISAAEAAQVRQSIGQLLMERRRFKEAAAEFQRALDLKAGDRSSRQGLEDARHRAATRPGV